ncbi:hypothetical protein LCGC14_1770590 [marine sediment metagenome]|uniref:Uncharacterized protein n=1 Tax=marine sediment metagenome TaxID=412755 RepID=A0A0F9JDA9_9ZZZZ
MSENTIDYFDEMKRLEAQGWFYKFYTFRNLSPTALRHIVFNENKGAMGMGHSVSEAWQNAIDSLHQENTDE